MLNDALRRCAPMLLGLALTTAAETGGPVDAHAERATVDRPLALRGPTQGTAWSPAPFEARYRARYDGIPFSARGRRILVRDDDGALRFFSDLRTVLLRVEEESRMHLGEDGSLTPIDYAYRQSGIGGGRERLLAFDWAAGEVRRSGDKQRVQPLGSGFLDPVSWQLALRRDVSSGALGVGEVVEYSITDGGEPKTYAIKLRGTESVDLPCGTFETVRLERIFDPEDPRETRIWLAPELGYMLVRLEAVDDSGRALRLELLETPEPA